jgi:hypothetical protein
MLKETIYTSLGAAALTAEFVTNPKRSQSWLKKAERRGSRLAARGEQQLRRLTKDAESALDDLRSSSMSALGLAEPKVARRERKTVKAVRRTARKARRSTPKARISRRTRRSGSRRVRNTTVSVQTPAIAS